MRGGRVSGIFEVGEDYQVIRPTRPFAAVGAGAQAALAALSALDRFPDLTLEQRARTALEVAEEHSSAVRGPFHFVLSGPRPLGHECRGARPPG
jgi:ATP-dependent protease HslVU (ClpYQ) peptidase subunit